MCLFLRYTAVSVIEMDFDRIDINQCPRGQGNSGPNTFADTSRCKKETTEVRKNFYNVNIIVRICHFFYATMFHQFIIFFVV